MTHGRYARDFPEDILGRYREAYEDTDILNLNAEIAVVTTRIAELIKSQNFGDSTKLWGEVGSLAASIDQAVGDQDLSLIESLAERLLALSADGRNKHETWNEIQTLNETKRRLVETQRKTLIDAQQMISADRLMVLLAAVVDVIRRNVTDERVFFTISNELRQIVDHKASRPPESGGELTLLETLAD